MKAKYEYEIISPAGRAVYILAETRYEAIRLYCEETGCPVDYVKRYCTVRNKGLRAVVKE